MTSTELKDELLERVLAGLGFSHRPERSPAGLRDLYAAWCRKVPFDNVRKLIHLRSGNETPFPGGAAEDFFEAWLKYGTGGTCWAGAGACYTLLSTLGFDAVRGVATMLAAPGVPPNHGTVMVRFGEQHFLVDCSMLHGEPLPLDPDADTSVDHPAWGVRCSTRDGRRHIAWRPLHRLDGLECRLESFDAERDDFARRYEQTRLWSPFNYELCIRSNRGQTVAGIGFGHKVLICQDGSVHRESIAGAERVRFLVEEMGLNEEIVHQLPADVPTPPPPWSKTAAMAGQT